MLYLFKMWAQLFLRPYVNQQNMSVTCQLLAFVLKQHTCSFSFSLTNSLAGIITRAFSPWRLASRHMLWGSSMNYIGRNLVYLCCLGAAYLCLPSTHPLALISSSQKQSSESSFFGDFLSFIPHILVFSSTANLRWESSQPSSMAVLHGLLLPLTNGEWVCQH